MMTIRECYDKMGSDFDAVLDSCSRAQKYVVADSRPAANRRIRGKVGKCSNADFMFNNCVCIDNRSASDVRKRSDVRPRADKASVFDNGG